jgi:hypothetical protein
MPFRDDDEAIRARNEALEQQAAELKEERDRLLAEKKEWESNKKHDDDEASKRQQKSKAKPKPEPEKPRVSEAEAERSGRWAGFGIGGVLVVSLVIGVGIGVRQGMKRDRARADYKAAVDARDIATKRWRALIGTEPCVRRVEISASYAREMVQRESAKKGGPPPAWVSTTIGGLSANCTEGAQVLATSTLTPLAPKSALAAWLEAESDLAAPEKAVVTYYDKKDYQEDGYASAPDKWRTLAAAMDARAKALGRVRLEALPALRAEIRDRQRAEEQKNGRSELWWRIEIGLDVWEIGEIVVKASGIAEEKSPLDPAAASRALKAPWDALFAKSKNAPIEVRRDLRRDDWVTSAVAANQPVNLEGLLNMTHDLDMLSNLHDKVPALDPLPPEPEDVD